MKKCSISFIYNNAFSQIGGLQQYNKNILSALEESNEVNIYAISLNDSTADIPNFKHVKVISANKSIIKFILLSIRYGFNSSVLVFGHVNLLFPLALFFRFFSKKRIVLITHGIDIWRPLSKYRKRALQSVTELWTVSEYTKSRIVELYPDFQNKIEILYNTVPPLLLSNNQTADKYYLRKKYNIPISNKIILSVCRITPGDREKGYDTILEVLPKLLEQYKITYVLAGKAENNELERLKQKVISLGISDHVVFTGMFDSKDLNSIYASCDVFILPSKKEGFGIVFIEALLHGKAVIAGNMDGSVDALQFGATGILIDPNSLNEIYEALDQVISGRYEVKGDVREKTFDKFGFDSFKKQLNKILVK